MYYISWQCHSGKLFCVEKHTEPCTCTSVPQVKRKSKTLEKKKHSSQHINRRTKEEREKKHRTNVRINMIWWLVCWNSWFLLLYIISFFILTAVDLRFQHRISRIASPLESNILCIHLNVLSKCLDFYSGKYIHRVECIGVRKAYKNNVILYDSIRIIYIFGIFSFSLFRSVQLNLYVMVGTMERIPY